MKVLVLGASGMLGNAVYRVLKNNPTLEVIGTSSKIHHGLETFDVLKDSLADLIRESKPNYIVNCIGKIKPEIDEQDKSSIERSIFVNSLFPLQISHLARDSRIIQIATDCVYSGLKGGYVESDKHDALDVYGKTKSLGEVASDNYLNIRCSIIGKEINTNKSLLEWFLNQATGSKVKGYSNHLWNGLTTHAFARLVNGLICSKESAELFGRTIHVVPGDVVNKFELLQLFAKVFERSDIIIESSLASIAVDRTLVTIHPEINAAVWSMGGYGRIPPIHQMLEEYVKFLSED